MSMIVLVFSAFILYTLACVCDGPDVKPRLRIFIGRRLERMANSLVYINYCKGANCPYTYVEPLPIREIVRPARVEARVRIGEAELFEAMYRDQFEQQHNLMPSRAKERLIEQAKETCVRNIIKRLERHIEVSVVDGDYEGGYYVIGRLEIDERLQETIR